MSKVSQPLQQPPTFVNDQQRQMVTNAQQAQQNFQLPQPSQPIPSSNEVMMGDDDATIQDMLNQISSEPQIPVQPQYQQINVVEPMLANEMQSQPMQQYVMPDNMSQVGHHGNYLSNIVEWNNKDIKVALYVIVAYLIVSFIPIEDLIYKYIQLNRIPYSGVIIKAVIAGILVYLMMKIPLF